MNHTLLQELKTALAEERDTLVRELKEIAQKNPRVAGDWNALFPKFEPSESGSHASEEEAADEVEQYEVNLEAEHSLESRLLAVTNALGRIKEGSYGICQKCKKSISPERLKANPAAEFDMACAATE